MYLFRYNEMKLTISLKIYFSLPHKGGKP
ncbi:nucleotide pyrophosphohydrolase, partial [Listeria monocytogenes]|nr:nucleotide pyrophosphohydrolase [Listeria monocytogenes]